MNKEDVLQQKIVIWFKNNYQIHDLGLIFSVPNGGSRNIVEAKKLKETGTMAGVSDLIVIIPNQVLFIELKIEKGIQSISQKLFESKVTKLGHEYLICRSLEQFKKIITNKFDLQL